MKPKYFNREKIITAILIIAFYVLIFIPNNALPMISDDFWYGKTSGNLFLVSIQHYLNWSGRILTDMTSRIILHYPVIVSSVKTIVLVALLVMIAILPSVILGKNVFSRVNLYLMFITYWLCNPALGQTTFWTVGASNYLFTNFWILLYLNLAFYLSYQEKVRNYQYVLLGITALGAGLSNENMGPAIFLFSVGMAIYTYRSHKKITNWIIGSGFNLLGATILILSPGNKIRLASLPSKFREMTFSQRVYNFFTDGATSKLFSNYGFLFLIFLCLIGLLILKKRVAKDSIEWSMIFFILAVISNFAFVLSPMIMVRALQGGFVLFLISLSFLVSAFISTDNTRISKVLFSSMLVFLSGLFVVSYVLEVNSFNLARVESNIRTDKILAARDKNENSVVIPSWYLGNLLRPKNDGYDTYLSPHYGSYYNYQGQIREVNVPFDYTNINNFKSNVEYISDSKVIKGVKSVKNIDSNCTSVIVLLNQIDPDYNVDLRIQFDKEVKDYNVSLMDTLKIKGYKFVSLNLDRVVFNGDVREADLIVTNNGKLVGKHSISIFR